MHGAWFILWWAWSAFLIAYLLLYVVAAKRLGGQSKERSEATFWVIVVLAVLRIATRFVLGNVLVYRVEVLFVGVAAGLALLDLVRMLMAQQDGTTTDVNGRNDRIQPLKLG